MLIFQDASFLQLLLWISAGLLVLSIGRMFLLGRQNRRLSKDLVKMENWAKVQQAEITTMHHDAQSWRAKTQRQFDALRTELGVRLEQSERSNQHAQKQLELSQDKATAAAQTRIKELEAALAFGGKREAAVLPPTAAIPALPAMETLRVESLEQELAAAKEEAEAQQQQNAELQRALLLARRKQPPARRNGGVMRVRRNG